MSNTEVQKEKPKKLPLPVKLAVGAIAGGDNFYVSRHFYVSLNSLWITTLLCSFWSNMHVSTRYGEDTLASR